MCKIYIGDAVKGKNKEIKLSSIVDQVWGFLPHGRLNKYLEYKAEEHGIKLEYISELYTSGWIVLKRDLFTPAIILVS